MAKPGLEEEWDYCARCDFRQPKSFLRKDPKTGLYFCTRQVVCFDSIPTYEDERQKIQSFGGLIFGDG